MRRAWERWRRRGVRVLRKEGPSRDGGDSCWLTVENQSAGACVLYWLDCTGKRLQPRQVQPGESIDVASFVHHSFSLDSEGTSSAVFTIHRFSAHWDRLVLRWNGKRLQETVEIQPDSLRRVYEIHTDNMSGFTVLIETSRSLAVTVLQTLEHDLRSIAQLLPPEPLSLLRDTTHIYINTSSYTDCPRAPARGLCFHPSAVWLQQHRLSTAKAGHIEVYNASDYMKWRTCWGPGGMLLHEMAHALHFRHSAHRFECRCILEAYSSAMKEKVYDASYYQSPTGVSGPARAYATTDAKEYFAEISVAFFGMGDEPMNKWFPFNRSQLAILDPKGLALCRSLWEAALPSSACQ